MACVTGPCVWSVTKSKRIIICLKSTYESYHLNIKKEKFCILFMKTCYRCNVSEGESLLYEGIGMEGVIFICNKCYRKNNIPLIEKKNIDMKEVEKRESVRERLARMAGIKVEKEFMPKRTLSGEDVSLKKIIEDNFQREAIREPSKVEGIANNFHWIIMRKRRIKKWSLQEFADLMFEPLAIVEALEKGVLPRDYIPVIKKVEGLLNIRLLKEKGEVGAQDIILQSKVPTGITISDLKEKQKEDISRMSYSEKPVEKVREIETVREIIKDNSDEKLDLDDISLDKVEEMVGKPIEDTPVVEEVRDETDYRKEFEEWRKKELARDELEDLEERDRLDKLSRLEDKDGLSQDDINDLVWSKD